MTATVTARRLSRWIGFIAVAALSLSPVWAQQVFSGDPIDPATGQPYTILPQLPLISSGPDGRFNTNDDVIDSATVGDVDVVVRSGGVFTGGIVPPPAGSVATAPGIVAGGGDVAAGSAAVFQVILVDGGAPAPVGSPILGTDLDGRGALVFAFADLDGDGFIGPRAADGAADDQVELQEIYTPVGRQVAVMSGGVADGVIDVSRGAPPSVGGLGIVLVAGAATGATPPIHDDGPWISTMLPYVPPLSPRDIIGNGNVRAADPGFLVEIKLQKEFEPGKVFLPATTDPLLGTAFAIPTDGSSPTVDLLRSESGPAVSARFANVVDEGSFVAAPARVLLVGRDAAGQRLLLEAVEEIALADDGPGQSVTVWLVATDSVGNPADPSAPLTLDLEVGPRVRIVQPNLDSDESRESVVVTTGAAIPIVIDDTTGLSGGGVDDLFVLSGGVPRDSLRIQLGGGSPSLPMDVRKVLLKRGRKTGRGGFKLKSDLAVAAGAADPATSDMTVTVTAGGVVRYARTFPAGLLQPARRSLKYKDPASVAHGPAVLVVRPPKKPSQPYRVVLRVRKLDLDTLDTTAASAAAQIQIGADLYQSAIACSGNQKRGVVICRP